MILSAGSFKRFISAFLAANSLKQWIKFLFVCFWLVYEPFFIKVKIFCIEWR